MTGRASVAFALVGLVLLAAEGFAQGTITGVVRDVDGRPLPGVTVVVLDLAPPSGTSRQTVTNSGGRFAVSDLVPSRAYDVSFLLPGFLAERLTVVPANVSAAFEVTLRVGSLAETVVVPLPSLNLAGPRLAPQVPGRPCLHDTGETEAEAARRSDALQAMRLIAHVISSIATGSRPAPYPSWQALAGSSVVDTLRQGSGAAAELARRIAWGGREPLPGWRISYAATVVDVRFALTDERDPCGFSYTSTDPQVIPPIARLLPLT